MKRHETDHDWTVRLAPPSDRVMEAATLGDHARGTRGAGARSCRVDPRRTSGQGFRRFAFVLLVGIVLAGCRSTITSVVRQAPGLSSESLRAGRIAIGGIACAVGSEQSRRTARLPFSSILASALSESRSGLETFTLPEFRAALGPERHDRLLDQLEQARGLDPELLAGADGALGPRARFLAVGRIGANTVLRRTKESVVSEMETGSSFWTERTPPRPQPTATLGVPPERDDATPTFTREPGGPCHESQNRCRGDSDSASSRGGASMVG